VSANPPADAQSVSDLKARVEAERAGRPFLVFKDGDGRQQLFFFEPGSGGASVGRLGPSDLLLDWDNQVSRLHARFELVGANWEVVDDGLSRNGTFVNGERLSGRRRLNDGDTLRFGTTTITFRSPGREQPGAARTVETPGAVETPVGVSFSGGAAAVSVTSLPRPAAPRLLVAAGVGAAIAFALGVYGRVHTPSQQLVFTLGLSSTIAMKVWLSTVVLAFAIAQVVMALWLYGKLPWPARSWLGTAHRLSGRIAFLVSLPVAYHCLWSLGFQSTNTRVLLHSLFGCAFYGAFAAKVTIVRSRGMPGWALPVAGGLVFTLLVLVWCLSALWFVQNQGFPSL
jgi:pSer/pThr/pTyr-binding forkhead associated (FHA) protein